MEKLLSVSEVSEQMGIPERTIRKWIKDEKIAAIKMPNSEWRFYPEYLNKWLQKRTVKAKNAL